MKSFLKLFALFLSLSLGLPLKAMSIDSIHVSKAERKMELLEKGVVKKTYRIALSLSSNNPLFSNGPKRLRGDQKTPEGQYKIIKKRRNTAFPLSLLINYPNESDIAWGKENGYSKKELGDMILIHGFPTKPNAQILSYAKRFGISEESADQWLKEVFYPNFDWTNGCIAVTDIEMEEIFSMIRVGTPIYIF